MAFELVFDFDHLARHQSIASLEEVRRLGWDSRLQAVAHFGDKFLAQIKNARALNVSDDGSPYIDFQMFRCDEEQLGEMVQRLAPYKYMAAIVYENVVRDAGHGVKLRVTGELCHDEYLRVSAQLTKSPRLVAMAADFRARRLRGLRYVAVHIRPYPDKCLYVWRQPQYNLKMAGNKCKNRNLFNVFVEQTQRAMRESKLDAVFVMVYPSLRARVSELYAAAGVQPIYYDEQDMVEEVGYKSVSLLGMLEEEIAFEADFFIGTSYSSMTWIIMQERFARGKPTSTTKTFTKTT